MKFLTIAAAIEQMTGKRPHPLPAGAGQKKDSRALSYKHGESVGRLTTLQAVQEFIEASTALVFGSLHNHP